MSAGSLTTSSVSPAGKSAQPLGQVAVVPSTPTDSDSSTTLKVLMCILQGLLHNVLSSDTVHLSILRARSFCPEVPKEEFDAIASKLVLAAQQARKQNPLAKLFD
jgi:hypothetical protein